MFPESAVGMVYNVISHKIPLCGLEKYIINYKQGSETDETTLS